MHVWLLAFPPVFESEKIVYDSLDLAQGFFYLASEEEAGHSSLSWPVLLERVEHVEAMQQDRGCCDRESGTGSNVEDISTRVMVVCIDAMRTRLCERFPPER